MKEILNYLKINKLGAPVLPPFEKFEGFMAAKVSRRNAESFVVAKWNGDFLTADVAFDPNANFGMVDEFLKLYSNEESDTEVIEDDPDGNFELTDNEEVDEELDGEELERGIIITSDKNSEVIFLEKKEEFPIFEACSSQELSRWLYEHGVSHTKTISKPEKVKLCEKYVADLDKSK